MTADEAAAMDLAARLLRNAEERIDALTADVATERDRASRLTLTLIAQQGAVSLVLEEMRQTELTGSAEAAVHAARWRERIETEIREAGKPR